MCLYRECKGKLLFRQEILVKIQDICLYVEPIFSSDIMAQMPEANLVHNSLLDLMKSVFRVHTAVLRV